MFFLLFAFILFFSILSFLSSAIVICILPKDARYLGTLAFICDASMYCRGRLTSNLDTP